MSTSALKRLGRHSAIYALGPAIQKALSFALLPVVLFHVGGSDDFGVAEMAAVTIAVAAQVLGINLLHGMTRFHPELGREEEQAALVSTTLLLLVATTGAGLVAAWAFAEPAAELLFGSREHAPAVVATAAILLLQTVGQVGLRWLQILERSALYGVLTTAKMLVEIALKVWFLVGLALGYMGILYSVVGGELCVAAGLGAVLVRRVGLRFSPSLARRLVRYSWPLFLSGLCMFALHQADRFFLLRWRGEDEVGVYALAYKLGGVANAILLEAFGLIWFPVVFSVRDEAERAALCRRALAWFTLAMGTATLALCVFGGEAVSAMAPPEFAGAARALPLIAAGYLCWGIFQVVHTGFYVRERTGIVAWLVAGGAAANLALNSVLVPREGYLGAAWATLLTFAGLAAVAWALGERVMPVGYEVGRVVAALVLGAGLWAAGAALPAESLGVAGTVIAKGALVLAFPLLLVAGGYLKGGEKGKIASAFRQLLRTGQR